MLMGAIPAQVAGVKEIAVVTPPRADGTLNPYMLAAAYLLDINEVYRVGGPWSIGALAYGTQEIRPVDVIAGPGNIFVTTAKKLVQGKVGIDMIAGPSEILVLADESANPEWVAADMLSQAEHDKLASAILITTSSLLADRVSAALDRRVAELPPRRHRPRLPRKLGSHHPRARPFRGRGHGQPHRPRTHGTLHLLSLGSAARHPPRRRRVHGPVFPRTRRRLLRRPRSARLYARHGPPLSSALSVQTFSKRTSIVGGFGTVHQRPRLLHRPARQARRSGSSRPFRGTPRLIPPPTNALHSRGFP